MSQIHVDPEGMEDLKNAFATAGEDYKSNLARLTNLVGEITSGNLQGPPADDLLAKYEEKKNIFDALAKTIDEGQEYMGIKGTKYNTMLSEVKAGMK